MTSENTVGAEKTLDDQAGHWVHLLPTADTDQKRIFLDWASQSAAHLRAFLEAQIREDEKTSRRRLTLGACFVVALAGAGIFAEHVARSGTTYGTLYETTIGEQREIELADHSIVRLDARTRVRVHYSETDRIVDLLKGQALFTVVGDAHHPFRVRSGAAQIEVLGTQFNVDNRKSTTVVTVVEGRLRVATNEPRGALRRMPANLEAGDQLSLTSNAMTRAETITLIPIDAKVVTAWTRGEGNLTFSATPLSTVVDEFNRYNARQIVLDPTVEDISITATFLSTDPRGLIEYLGRHPGMTLEETEREIYIRSASRQH